MRNDSRRVLCVSISTGYFSCTLYTSPALAKCVGASATSEQGRRSVKGPPALAPNTAGVGMTAGVIRELIPRRARNKLRLALARGSQGSESKASEVPDRLGRGSPCAPVQSALPCAATSSRAQNLHTPTLFSAPYVSAGGVRENVSYPNRQLMDGRGHLTSLPLLPHRGPRCAPPAPSLSLSLLLCCLSSSHDLYSC